MVANEPAGFSSPNDSLLQTLQAIASVELPSHPPPKPVPLKKDYKRRYRASHYFLAEVVARCTPKPPPSPQSPPQSSMGRAPSPPSVKADPQHRNAQASPRMLRGMLTMDLTAMCLDGQHVIRFLKSH